MMSMRRAVPLIWVVTGVNLMSLLDAVNTILIVGDDAAGELNPLMGALIERNIAVFFALKLLMTFSSTFICWHYYEEKQAARATLRWISCAYCCVMVWQALLLSGAIAHFYAT
jgi:Domain of unknown function (DUF5658)